MYCAHRLRKQDWVCWPKMETLAATLDRSVRTTQCHMHPLSELGLIEFFLKARVSRVGEWRTASMGNGGHLVYEVQG